jgi:hypothetical protein
MPERYRPRYASRFGSEHPMMGPGIDPEISDAELTALALAADPEREIEPDAAPLDEVLGTTRTDLLPAWYMASPMLRAGVLRGWRRNVIWVVIAAFLTITAYGLCNTYGDLVLP